MKLMIKATFCPLPPPGTLQNPMLWVEALSQNAFDTGAGSGMFITYSSYIAREESIGKYAVGIPISNNLIRCVSV
jgi:NSS family neurotransmitter:Na+ symporter